MSENHSNNIKERIYRKEYVKAIKERLHSQEMKLEMRNNEQIETTSFHQSKEHERVLYSDQES